MTNTLTTPTTPTETTDSNDLFDAHLQNRLRELYPEDVSDQAKAVERLSRELEIIRREKYTEYFIDLADVVMLAKQNGLRFWCLWEPLNRSLVAHLLGANPLNPIAWNVPSPRWPENGAKHPPHLTLMLHLSEAAEPVIRRAAVEYFGELKAYELGLLPEMRSPDDRTWINSRPAHIALWLWRDLDLQERCLKLVHQKCDKQIELEKLPLDSTEVFDLFYQGHTLGLFHVEAIPNEYFRSCFQKLRPGNMRELAVIFGHFSPKGIPKMEWVWKKLSAFPKDPQHTRTEELRRLFDEMPSSAQSLSTAWFAYQMAWLKIHYPREFYEALLGEVLISNKMREGVAMEKAARGLEGLPEPQVIEARMGLSSTGKLLDSDLKRRFTLGVLFRYWGVSFDYANRVELLQGALPHWPILPDGLTALSPEEDSRLAFSEDQLLSLLRSFTGQESEAVDQLLELCREVVQPCCRNREEAFLKVERELINIYRLATYCIK